MTAVANEGIIILGLPRSGTTLLQRLLNTHPAIHCPPERYLLSACSRFLYEEPTVRGINVGVIPGLRFDGFEPADIRARLREFALAFFRDSAAREGKEFWAEKTAFDIFHLDHIETLFAEKCRFIGIVRHGLDVAISMRELIAELDLIHVELRPYFQSHNRPLTALCHAWIEQNRRLLEFAADHPERTLLLKYEELVTDPLQQLEQLFSFLELPTEIKPLIERTFQTAGSVGIGDWKTFETKSFHSESIGRWKTLHQDAQSRLGELINPSLHKLGYDTIPVQHDSEEESRRLFQIGRMVKQMQSHLNVTPSND